MRTFFTSLLVALVIVPMGTTINAAQATSIVKTEAGSIRGQMNKAAISFLGVSYGASTEGKARFLPPQKVAPWQGVRDALHTGARCPQPDLSTYMKGEIATMLAFADDPISEDCLNLNVWTPAIDGKKRPVMVWFHGGGFFLGSAQDPFYEGSNLSVRNDVVVVSVNGRLGALGYLALGADAGPEYAASGLAGMEDLVLALRWVKNNIAAFGGNPENVTIFGQSGGGSKSSALMGMPSAQGLFHKAIIMSGAMVSTQTKSKAVESGERILKTMGLTSGDIDKLQAMPLDELVQATTKAGLYAFFPSADGKVLPRGPFDPQASEYAKNVTILIGTMKYEGTTTSPWQAVNDEETLLKFTTGIFKGNTERAQQAIDLYRKAAPEDSPGHIFASISTDNMFVRSSIIMAERRVAQQGGAPVYMYRFDWNTPIYGGKYRSPHAGEIPFVFDNIDVASGLVGTGSEQQPLADTVSRSFAAFARTGNPSTASMPDWPTYSLQRRDTMIYDTKLSIVQDPSREKRLFWQSIQP